MSGVQGMVLAGLTDQGRKAVKIPPHVRSRELTDEVIRFWARTMRDEEAPYPARVDCSKQIMDRAWGKAPIIVAGDETRPITIDVRTIDSDRLAHLEEALMLALGEGIANVAFGDSVSGDAPGAPSGIAALANGPMQTLPIAQGLGTIETNQERDLPGDGSSAFVLDGAAMQHGDAGAERGGEGDGDGA